MSYACYALFCSEGKRERLVKPCSNRKTADDMARRFNKARHDKLYYVCRAFVVHVNGRRKYKLIRSRNINRKESDIVRNLQKPARQSPPEKRGGEK